MIHHIIPRHEWKVRFGNFRGFNSQDNLVNLTIEQHIQSHQLLFEINKNEYDRVAYLALFGLIGKEEVQRRAVSVANTGKRYALGCKRSDDTKKLISEANKGKRLGPGYVRTTEHKRRQSISMLGNKNSLGAKRSVQWRKRLSIYKLGCSYEVIICPNCGKSGGSNTMRRWHFDNCKNGSIRSIK